MNREAKIGLFVLVAMSAMVYFIMRTSDITDLVFKNKAPKRLISIVLDDASGIREDTDVRIAGVKVGKVTKVGLEGNQAVAVISVPADMQFREGARAELMNQGVLGERFVSLNLGTGEPLPQQDRLDGKTPASLDTLTNNINLLAENLITITENLKQSTLTDQGDNRLELIAENFEKLTESLLIMLEANRGNIDNTTTQVSQLTVTLNRDIPVLVAEMTSLARDLRTLAGGNRGNIDDTMNNVASLSENMTRVSESLSSITSKIDEGDGTLGKLVNEGETVEKLNTLLDTANESVGEVKKLIDKATDIELDFHFRGEYLANQETERGFLGATIWPNERKYYQVEAVFRDTDHLDLKFDETLQTVFDADGNVVNTIVTQEFEEEDDVVFNGVLAYQVGHVFVKGGLMESSPGAGLDYFNDSRKLKFSLEMFDLDRNNYNLHGKLFMNYLYRDHLELVVGWDDFAEPDLSTAMIGGGIRWKDEDLKILFGSMGSLFR